MEAKAAATPERQTLVKHLRRHGKATSMHLWCSTCRWCRLELWWWRAKDPASGDALSILQDRVTKLEAHVFDGDRLEQ